jgi:hypothetical protein
LKENQGFSYQRHEEYKTELFHFLEDGGRSLAYLADFDDYLKVVQKQSLEEFHNLRTGPHEQFVFHPESGDVLKVDKIGDVHTVLGGNFEEYANTSKDKVSRLFDQNERDFVAPGNRHEVLKKIENLRFPFSAIELNSGKKIESVRDFNSVVFTLSDKPELKAFRLKVLEKFSIETGEYLYSLFCTNGAALLRFANMELEINKSGSVLLPPGCSVEVEGVETDFSVCAVPFNSLYGNL